MQRVVKKVNQGRAYLFSTPTKAVEFLNGCCMFFFGLVFIFNGAALGQFKFYMNFTYIAPPWLWWLAIVIGLIQLNSMRRDTLESNIMSVLMLKLSSLVWFVFAVLFGSEYPPLSTGFFTYTWVSFICLMAGFHLGGQNTYELLIREEYRDT